MSNRSWTSAQKKAITSLDGSLIVSAAAGSGKTAVLIERIINRICSDDKPCNITDLLVVTFTRAAASEMRDRLSSALKEKVSESPENTHIRRQLLLLPIAEICTMDQFLNNLVQNNYQLLDITPDYRIIDGGENELLSSQAINEVLDELYDEDSVEFNTLLDLFGCDRRDEQLVKSIVRLNDYSSAYAHPEKWLQSIVKNYEGYCLPQDTEFGKIILDKITDYARYALELISDAKGLVAGIEALSSVYSVLIDDENMYDRIFNLAQNKEWNELKATLEGMTFGRFPSIRNEYKSSYEKVYAKEFRDKAKGIMEAVRTAIPADEKEYADDIEKLNPIVNKLIEATIRYKKRFSQKKNEQNSLDFSDIEHYALDLLVREDNTPTNLALELRKGYKEILIDEYQDTNEAQDAIFCALSENKSNMFLVGDVKQSIYRFRLAMPQVFLGRMREWKENSLDYPMSLSLDKNFRSRADILDSVNYIFRKVMTERIGDMVYDDDEALKAGAEYPDTDEPSVEVCVLDRSALNETEEDYKEIDFIVDKVKAVMHSHMKIKDGNTLREVQYKDICVLIRKKKIGAQLCELFKLNSVPSYFEDDKGFFSNTEVTVMLSLLSIIDNPLQDVPLMSVLMSSMFGFMPDDIAKIRVTSRREKLFYALKNSTDEKCRDFFNTYNELRRLSTVMSVSALIRTIYESTAYPSVVSALENGDNRKLNLYLLLEYATDYEANSSLGLAGFIRFIDRIKENESDLRPASSVSEYANVVRIMTVHKSKGLEFPVVILADCGNPKVNRSQNLIIHEKTGVGLKICDKANFRQYSTVQFAATKALSNMSDCSEELRILYVAMTRAREKLIITGEVSNAAKKIRAAALDAFSTKINSVAIENASSFLDIILMGYMRHPSAQMLRDFAQFGEGFDTDTDCRIKFDIISSVTKPELNCEAANDIDESYNEELLLRIKERTSYEYKFLSLANCATKMAASSFNMLENNAEFFASEKPKFVERNGLSGADRGTAMHRFMEICSFERSEENLENEIQQLVLQRKLTQQQAEVLDRKALSLFFKSKLYNRMKKSDRVLREQKFTITVPVTMTDDSIDKSLSDEEILVQGIIDCAFFENGSIVISDYKTDKVKTADELRRRYHRQIEIYKTAAQQVFGVNVSDILLYSFYLGCEVEIKI